MLEGPNSTRRRFLLAVGGVGAVSARSFVRGQPRGGEDETTFTVPSGAGFDSEVKVMETLPGVDSELVAAETTPGPGHGGATAPYNVRIDQSTLDDPTPEQAEEQREDARAVLQRIRSEANGREESPGPPVTASGPVAEPTPPALSTPAGRPEEAEGPPTLPGQEDFAAFENRGEETTSLGEGVEFAEMGWGGVLFETAGNLAVLSDGAFDLDEGKATAAALTGGGFGRHTVTSQVGVPFVPEGQGSETAHLRVSGNHVGVMSTFGTGSSTATISFGLVDAASGLLQDRVIFADSGSQGSIRGVSDPLNAGIVVHVTGGRSYVAFLKIECQVAAGGLAEAGADFGPGDGDDDSESPQGVYLSSMQLAY